MSKGPGPTFCILPWNHISMESANLEYKMCCVTDEVIPEGYSAMTSTAQEALTSPYMNSVRKSMLAGEKVEACKACYQEEKGTLRSMRTFYLENNKDRIENYLSLTNENGEFKEVPIIEHLELRLGNLCNLKCVMCNPLNSSSYDDYGQIFGIHTKNTKTVSEIQSSDLEKIYPVLDNVKQLTFRGGEPLINRKHEEVLDYLIDQGLASKISLTYTSNGSVIPERLKKDWDKFRKVTLWISVDGTGETNNFIRYPSRWEIIEANLKKLDEWAMEIPQLCWGITTTVQAYNLHALPELIELTSQFRTCYPYPFINSLHYPEELRVENLPSEMMKQSVSMLRESLLKTEFAVDESPIGKTILKFKQHAQTGKKNRAAVESLLNHLENCQGGDHRSVRTLKELTDKIIRERKTSELSFLRKVF